MQEMVSRVVAALAAVILGTGVSIPRSIDECGLIGRGCHPSGVYQAESYCFSANPPACASHARVRLAHVRHTDAAHSVIHSIVSSSASLSIAIHVHTFLLPSWTGCSGDWKAVRFDVHGPSGELFDGAVLATSASAPILYGTLSLRKIRSMGISTLGTSLLSLQTIRLLC